MMHDVAYRWTAADSSELYGVPHWGAGYFSVHENGHLLVHPNRRPEISIDLKQVVDLVQMRGLGLPLLVRFSGMLRDRIAQIHGAFQRAIDEYGYQGRYSCVYPIKVNQQHQVIQEVVKFGRAQHVGLEAGSKSELLAAIAMAETDSLIICNGFKDDDFIEMALLAQKMGRQTIPVIEKFSDLELILRYADKLNLRPRIGIRAKLAARGAGRWHMSGGYQSKFGLTVTEILAALDVLKKHEMADCLKLLHFHQGSQVTNIRHIKTALVESARIYADLANNGAGLEYLDVGGGLGIDYDGSRTDFASSMNYSLQEYGNDVVYHIQSVCDDAGIAHPHIISESGRAIVGYHSVLVFAVRDVMQNTGHRVVANMPASSVPAIEDLKDTLRDLTIRNALESFHDAQQALDMVINMFGTGHLSLRDRADAESLFWAICRAIRRMVDDMEFVPEELAQLDQYLADTYFCNFSLFQSMPDSWAVNQLFPVMPIHRLDEQPVRPGVLADITCDSDGKIDRFIDRRDVKRTLPLHELRGEPYLLGAFMVGAYQEILGDMHNLFGDTNAVHVDLNEAGEIVLESIIAGDRVSDVLQYVGFQANELVQRLQAGVERAVQAGRITHIEAGRCMKFYKTVLDGYTYLEETHTTATAAPYHDA